MRIAGFLGLLSLKIYPILSFEATMPTATSLFTVVLALFAAINNAKPLSLDLEDRSIPGPTYNISAAANGSSFDVIIIGGGPAGLSALSGLARVRRNALLIDSAEYRNGETRHVHDLIGLDRKQLPS